MRVTTCGIDLLLRLSPQLFEPGPKRTNLDVGGAFQFLAVLLCRRANLTELPFRFLADLRGDLLRRGRDRSLLLLCGRTQDLLRKIVQLGFEMLAQAGRRAVNRRADLIVESH